MSTYKLFESKLRTSYFFPVLLCIIGIFFAFYPSIRTGELVLPGDIGDGRLNHFFLEHAWLNLIGETVNKSYWDASFFYPTKNMMASSDVLLTLAPIYYLFRLVSIPAEHSYLFWAIVILLLNYISMYILLRKACSLSPFAAAGGAFVFTFCAARLIKMGHIQLICQAYTILFIFFMYKFYTNVTNSFYTSGIYLTLATLCIVSQLYAGWYHGWYLIFGVSIYFIISLCFQESRKFIINVIKTRYKLIFLCCVLSLVCLYPFITHYYTAKVMHGDIANLSGIYDRIPQWNTWIRNPSILYQKLHLVVNLRHEHLGLGVCTLLIGCYGLLYLMARKNVWLLSLVLTVCCIVLLSLNINGFSFWPTVWKVFPGASSLRAASRIFFFVLIFLSIGFAYAVDRQKNILAFFIVLICAMEIIKFGNIAYPANYTKNHSVPLVSIINKYELPFLIAQEIKPKQRYPYPIQLDAMWASLLSKKPTLNGYTGLMPRQYREAMRQLTCDNAKEIYSYIPSLTTDILFICVKDDGTYEETILIAPAQSNP